MAEENNYICKYTSVFIYYCHEMGIINVLLILFKIGQSPVLYIFFESNTLKCVFIIASNNNVCFIFSIKKDAINNIYIVYIPKSFNARLNYSYYRQLLVVI